MSTPPTADNLQSLLARCATEAPASWRDQRQSQGFTHAGELLGAARAAAIDPLPALRALLNSDSADETWLALTFMPLDELVAAGLTTIDGNRLHPDAREELRVKLGLATARGLVPYDPRLRAERREPGGRALLAALIAHDFAWVFQHPREALGPALPQARFDLGFSLAELSRDEVLALHDALARNTVGLPDDWAATLAADVARHIAAGATFSPHVSGVRFKP